MFVSCCHAGIFYIDALFFSFFFFVSVKSIPMFYVNFSLVPIRVFLFLIYFLNVTATNVFFEIKPSFRSFFKGKSCLSVLYECVYRGSSSQLLLVCWTTFLVEVVTRP